MNFNLFVRYLLEISLIIPMIIFAVIPVKEYLKFNSVFSFSAVVFLIFVSVFAGAFLGVKYNLRVRTIFVPLIIIFSLFYIMAVDLKFNQKLFCLFYSFMISSLCPMLTIFITAHIEFTNMMWRSLRLFTIQSGLVSLGVSFILGLVFFKTLTLKLPALLREESILETWKFFFLIPFAMFLLICWMTPISPLVVITGRVKPIGFVLTLFVATFAILLCHVFWKTTATLTESAKLQQENNLLQMEGKRYNALKNYMQETRALRHDFRQHLAVISSLSNSEKFSELKDYISQLTSNTSKNYKTYCANNAVDAMASYYDGIASTQETEIKWKIELPSELPMKEADFCVVLGNLVENALNAAKKIPVEERKIKVMSSMLSNSMLGLSIDNKFEGSSLKNKGHGIGLISVANTVKRYGGNLNINAENNIFSVDIILYFN